MIPGRRRKVDMLESVAPQTELYEAVDRGQSRDVRDSVIVELYLAQMAQTSQLCKTSPLPWSASCAHSPPLCIQFVSSRWTDSRRLPLRSSRSRFRKWPKDVRLEIRFAGMMRVRSVDGTPVQSVSSASVNVCRKQQKRGSTCEERNFVVPPTYRTC
jgi:uncharacterized protein YbdZ (MbtH family)